MGLVCVFWGVELNKAVVGEIRREDSNRGDDQW